MRLARVGKRGEGSTWMTEETARIIVAVLVIVLLFLLVSKLGSIFFKNQEYEQAKATMAEIESLAAKTSSETRTLLIESPKNWALMVNGKGKLCFCSLSVIKVDSSGRYFSSCELSSMSVCSEKENFSMPVFSGNQFFPPVSFWKSMNVFATAPLVAGIEIAEVPFYLSMERKGSFVSLLNRDEIDKAIASVGSSTASTVNSGWSVTVDGKVTPIDISVGRTRLEESLVAFDNKLFGVNDQYYYMLSFTKYVSLKSSPGSDGFLVKDYNGKKVIYFLIYKKPDPTKEDEVLSEIIFVGEIVNSKIYFSNGITSRFNFLNGVAIDNKKCSSLQINRAVDSRVVFLSNSLCESNMMAGKIV